MQRIVRWKIADHQTAIDPQERYQVQLRFRLDLSQLPAPLQIGRWGRSGWNVSLARSLRWSPGHAMSETQNALRAPRGRCAGRLGVGRPSSWRPSPWCSFPPGPSPPATGSCTSATTGGCFRQRGGGAALAGRVAVGSCASAAALAAGRFGSRLLVAGGHHLPWWG